MQATQAQATKCPAPGSPEFTAALNGPQAGRTKAEHAAAAAAVAVAFGIGTAGGWADMRAMPKAELLAYAEREIYAPARAAAKAALAAQAAAREAEAAADHANPQFAAAKGALLMGLARHTQEAAERAAAFAGRAALGPEEAAYELAWRADEIAKGGALVRKFGRDIAWVWEELAAPKQTAREFAAAVAEMAATMADYCMRAEPRDRAEFAAGQAAARFWRAVANHWAAAMDPAKRACGYLAYTPA